MQTNFARQISFEFSSDYYNFITSSIYFLKYVLRKLVVSWIMNIWLTLTEADSYFSLSLICRLWIHLILSNILYLVEILSGLMHCSGTRRRTKIETLWTKFCINNIDSWTYNKMINVRIVSVWPEQHFCTSIDCI